MRPAAVLVLLLLVPAVHAAPDAPLASRASTDGDYVLDGALVALRHQAPLDADADPSLGFRLEAASLLVEEEHGGALAAAGANLLEAEDRRSSRYVTGATVREDAVRPGRDVTVLAVDARVLATGSGASWGPPQRTTANAQDEVEFPDRRTSVPVGHTVQMDATPSVTVTGRFIVLVSGMDLFVEGDDGGRVHSAETREDLGTATYRAGVPMPTTRNVTELVLHVHDGVLHLGPGARTPWVHVTDPVVHLASARLDGISGPLPTSLGAGSADGSTLSLRGDLRLALAPAGEGLSWSLGGRVEDASLDGRTLAVVTPLFGGPAARAWLSWATTLMLLGVLGTGLPLQRRRARRRLQDAELLFAAGHFQAAAEVARPLPLGGLHGPAAALRVQALLYAGAVGEARRLARTTPRGTDPLLARLVRTTVDDWEAEE